MTKGGITSARETQGYSAPKGPKGIDDPQGPGLHGNNSGCTNQPTGKSTSGSVGLGGDRHGNAGTQGRH